MSRIRKHAIQIWLVLFAVALGLYFFWSEPLKRVALNLVPALMAGCFLVSFAGLGYLPSRYLAAGHGRTIQFLTSTAFGAGITGLVVFALGLMGMFSRPFFLLWTVAGIVAFVPAVMAWQNLRPETEMSGMGDGIAKGTLLLFLVAAIPFAVAPEVTTDALEYHLLIPRIYLSSGRIALIPLLVESNYPNLVEYLYLPMLALTNPIVCKCFHYLSGLLLLVLMGRMVRKISPESSPYWAPALFVSMPVVAVVFGWAWNDLILTFFLLLSLYYLICYNEAPPDGRKDRDLLLAGLCAGLAAWTKYTFAVFLLALLFLSWVGVRRWRWNEKKLTLLFLPILFFVSLWAIKNWIFTGNPVFPFLNDVFHSPYFTPEASAYFKESLTRYEFPDWGWKHYLLFPFYISLKARILDVYTGILPLVLLPLVFFRFNSPSARLLKVYVAIYAGVWLLIQTLVRSMFSVLAVIFILASIPLQRMASLRKNLRVVLQILLIMTIASNFFVTILSTYYLFDPVKFFFGRETRTQYLLRQAKSQPVYQWLNSQEDARFVLLIGLHNPLYLEKPFLFSGCCDPPLAEVLSANIPDSGRLASKLRDMGVTHVVIDFEEYRREHKEYLFSWSDEQRKVFEEFVKEHCRQVQVFGRDAVFIINQ